jgi:DNA repair protein RecN (Recombination protein N)
MLTGLSIHDVVLIDSLDLQFDEGFSALTGETGAGKSILLDSLSLALGMRGDTSLIRQGAEQAVVIAEFNLKDLEPTHPLRTLLDEQGFDSEHNPLILRRVLHPGNKSRALVNDHPVSIALLREIGQLILEIHGQFDHLMNVSLHHKILDSFAVSYYPDLEGLFVLLEDAYEAWKKANQELVHQKSLREEALKQQSHYRQLLEDLDKLMPLDQEEDSLLQERQDISHYGKISEAVQGALNAFRLPTDIQTTLYTIQKSLERVNVVDLKNLTEAIAAIDRANIEVQEAYELLRVLYDLNQESTEKLHRIEERLHSLRAVARKYGLQPSILHQSHHEAREAVGALEDGDEHILRYQQEVIASLKRYEDLAEQVFIIRSKAARKLEEMVMMELPDLKLPHALFKVVITKQEQPSSKGSSHIEFFIAVNKGQELAPLVKAASGGEMARLMLALKVVLAHHGYISTIVFDEIDTGVGGAVAAAIGQRLARLSETVQILSITHSPQVAAYAQNHFYVSKREENHKMVTSVKALSDNERQEELARMLSGAVVTEEARAAARQLLKDAREKQK